MKQMRRRWARRPDGAEVPPIGTCRRLYNPRRGACPGLAEGEGGAPRGACETCANLEGSAKDAGDEGR